MDPPIAKLLKYEPIQCSFLEKLIRSVMMSPPLSQRGWGPDVGPISGVQPPWEGGGLHPTNPIISQYLVLKYSDVWSATLCLWQHVIDRVATTGLHVRPTGFLWECLELPNIYIWDVHNRCLEHSQPVIYLFFTLALQKVTFSILPINFIKHFSSHSLFYTTLY